MSFEAEQTRERPGVVDDGEPAAAALHERTASCLKIGVGGDDASLQCRVRQRRFTPKQVLGQVFADDGAAQSAPVGEKDHVDVVVGQCDADLPGGR